MQGIKLFSKEYEVEKVYTVVRGFQSVAIIIKALDYRILIAEEDVIYKVDRVVGINVAVTVNVAFEISLKSAIVTITVLIVFIFVHFKILIQSAKCTVVPMECSVTGVFVRIGVRRNSFITAIITCRVTRIGVNML